ncbi:MAG: hypothetical protein E4G96_06845 [Chrysiogenales bacterium]|nr:MAG: hypothetical protein E4G96_06845 [Chrysiogenales bacterium]
MDVRSIQGLQYPPPRPVENTEGFSGMTTGAEKTGMPFPFAKDESVSQQVREEVIMNLQEVQNFLYMLIGSKIRIESDAASIGSSVNTAV